MAEINNEVQIVTLSSDCFCEYFDEELDSYVPCASCDGDCWDLAYYDYDLFFKEWLVAHPDQLTEILEVDGEGVGWMRQSGSAFVRADAKQLLDLFTLRGDFRLEFTFEGRELRVRRWSHDEPTGSAVFVVRVSELDTLPDGDAL